MIAKILPAAESPYLSAFFEFLNTRSIAYCVMNNYVDYPQVIPSDIDITIDEATFNKLDSLIYEFSAAAGLLITQKIWHGYKKCAYILSLPVLTQRFRLQLDFFVDFTAKGYWRLLSHEDMVSTASPYKNFYIPSPQIEAVFLLMRRVIKGDATPEKIREIRQLCGTHNDVIRLVGERFGREMANFVEGVVANPEAFLITGLARSRAFLKGYSSRRSNLAYKFAYLGSEIPRLTQRIKYPVGIAICFLSPDGGGKTTVIAGVEEALSGSFHGVQKLYWRPGLLPHMGMLKFWNPPVVSEVNPDPHGHGAQNPVKSLVRFCYYLIDYGAGFYFRIAPMRIRKKLVIFDRYYFDYLIDLHRYKMTIPKGIPRFFLRFIPKPDITFVLDCAPEIMMKRKRELTLEELRRQHAGYLELAKTQDSFTTIDSSRPLEDVCKEIAAVVLKKKAQITAHSLNLV